jgi:tryptophanyl-tRNA synthetase
MKNIVKEYCTKLDKLGISYKLLEHPKMREVQDVMDYLGFPIEDGFSTLVMKTEKGYVAIIRRDDHKLSVKKAKRVLGVKELEMVESKEFEKLTGLPSGAVHILPPVKKMLLDKKLFDKEFLIGGSGSLDCSVKYKTEELRKIPGAVVEDLIIDEKKQVKINRVLSGITPSGDQLHIGNYFGAVKPQFDLQAKTEACYYFVADLHALTTVQDRDRLELCIVNNVLDYIALGLDVEKSVYFRQSDVPEHSMLAVVLANYVSFGLTNRMHAFKDKLAKGVTKESINMGLFNYPILMAADILLYKSDGVPVGEDQRQHIEFARNVAKSFNKTHKKTFPIPEPLIGKGSKGKLVGTDGERKMSKSLGNKIDIFSDEKVIKKQIMSCFTDPNRIKATDPGKVEGNPVFIYHDFINDDKKEVQDLKDRYRKGKVGDVEVKEKLFEAHMRMFKEAREKRKELEKNPDIARKVLKNGAEKAREFAKKTLAEVYEVIGITNKLNS